MSKRKRRLTENELKELRKMMAEAPEGYKPTVRQLARHFGVNQPSILKAMKLWKGMRRGRPEPAKESKFVQDLAKSASEPPIKIEGFTQDIKPEDIRI